MTTVVSKVCFCDKQCFCKPRFYCFFSFLQFFRRKFVGFLVILLLSFRRFFLGISIPPSLFTVHSLSLGVRFCHFYGKNLGKYHVSINFCLHKLQICKETLPIKTIFAHLTMPHHIFFRPSKVWSMLHHGPVEVRSE